MRQQAARNDEKVVSMDELKRARERRASTSRAVAEPARPSTTAHRNFQEKQPKSQHAKQSQAKPGRFGLAALFVLLALLAVTVLMGMSIFQIHEVQVTGNSTISAQDVITLSGVRMGENIFKVDTVKVKGNIESDALLELVHIERVFPDKIRLDIRQRIPHGAIAYMGRFVIIDEKGCVLDTKDQLPAGQYPLVIGMDIKHSEKGKPVQSNDQASLDAMEAVLTALQKVQALPLIAQADFKDLLNITLLTRDGMVVELGKPTDMDAKAMWITSTIPELQKKGCTKGVLYLTSSKGPVYSASQDATNNTADSSATPQETAGNTDTAPAESASPDNTGNSDSTNDNQSSSEEA
jgi:cell division protein FtsQ